MYKVAVVGIGRVAIELLDILYERNFPMEEVFVISSNNDIGKRISYGEDDYISVKDIENFDFLKVDFAFFSANDEISLKYVEKIAQEGVIVIDCSSVFSDDLQVPLVVPEVNIREIYDYRTKGIISSPNCTSVILSVVLAPLHKAYGIKRVVVSTYQSVSGAGSKALDELFNQTRGIYANQSFLETKEVFTKQIAFNLIPQIGAFLEDGYTKEEMTLINETKRLIDDRIQVVATCVRVPVFISHAMSVNIEFDSNINKENIKECLVDSEGIAVVDYNVEEGYVTPVECAGEDKVYVSRIRADETLDNAVSLWVVADNLRKGSALNMVQIAEEILKIID